MNDALITEDEEILSENCEIRSLIFYNQNEESQVYDFSQFNFQTKKGIVTILTMTKEKSFDLEEEGEEDSESEDSAVLYDSTQGNEAPEGYSEKLLNLLSSLDYDVEVERETNCVLLVRQLNNYYDFSWFTKEEFGL